MLDISGQTRLVEVVVAVCASEPLTLEEMLQADHTQTVRDVTHCEAVLGKLQTMRRLLYVSVPTVRLSLTRCKILAECNMSLSQK